jgi:hypothetical protein
VPDSDPQVLLAGFGLEDTHSVANSLRWGPDGWLYGAHGSTVTAHITRPGLDKEPIAHMIGQGIWRYHPETRRFEVFAEGGGNTFGVEFDAQGRLFSGHNGGDTRGFHYMQGAYLRKGFEKHGQLSNPYAFGFYEPMQHAKAERFSHNFIIYEGGALSEKYEGKIFAIEPLQGRVMLAERTADGSTFRTRDLGPVVTTTDRWFRPSISKPAPTARFTSAISTSARSATSRARKGIRMRRMGGCGGCGGECAWRQRDSDRSCNSGTPQERWDSLKALRFA